MPDKADITIIGAGVVGLAIAAQLARANRQVYVLEKNEGFGLETSSRHSGVIHAGIYYPKDSVKAKLCVAGNRILYDLCNQYDIGHKRLGKLIVAVNDDEVEELEKLLERGRRNDAADLRLLSSHELKALELNVEGVAAMLSPSSGIVDSHGLMQYFIARAMEGGAQVAYRSRVVDINKANDGYEVTVEDSGGKSSFSTGVLINSAGLYSDKVAGLAGIDTNEAGYRLHYCKGEYFSLRRRQNTLVNRLIYPVPPSNIVGVGIHITTDLEGRVRLGPSHHYVDSLDYSVDNRYQELFYDSVKKLLPAIDYDDLEPEMAGIRPKLQEAGGEFRDFVIRDEAERGLPGLINLIGIESPGLTAAPAIAEYVAGLVEGYL
ncbi:MAG: NAD(P)/FAD-dependent oxidoreductase [Dehalococcoidia bacterium]|jgi:L-2-hydroxyglutarate oxidase LhgO